MSPSRRFYFQDSISLFFLQIPRVETSMIEPSLIDPEDLARRLESSLTGLPIENNGFPMSSSDDYLPKLTLDETFEPVPSEGK